MRYRLWPRGSNQVAELLLLHAGDTVPFQRIEAMPEAPTHPVMSAMTATQPQDTR